MNAELQVKAKKVIEVCLSEGIKIGACESFTGGGFANALTNIPRSSQVFKGAIVAYTNEAKVNLLQVNPAIIAQQGAISAACVEEMILNGAELLEVDLCVGFSGNADRNVSEQQPPFFSFIGFYYHKQSFIYPFSLPDTLDVNRETFKVAAIMFALDKISELLT